jgi:hypothetical protein
LLDAVGVGRLSSDQSATLISCLAPCFNANGKRRTRFVSYLCSVLASPQ